MWSVKVVSDRRRNPFGIDARCPEGVSVPGFGEPNADFHLIGDHPGRHGGVRTGIPFSDPRMGDELHEVLATVGLLTSTDRARPATANLFMSYRHLCSLPGQRTPTEREYQRLERFFDAELRAVNAHVLLPVGRRTVDHVLQEYTTQAQKVPTGMQDRHALDIRGRGFLVIPIADPRNWVKGDRQALETTLGRITKSDYRQTKGVATLVG